jgi:hypothetical protein
MKKLVSILLVNCIFSNVVLASCLNPVQYLTKGAIANCDGFLFSIEKEQELRLIKEDYKLLKIENEALKHKDDLYSKQLEISDQIAQKEAQKAELWRQRAEDITLKYVTVENNKPNRDYMFFGLGIITTILTGYVWGLSHK